MEKDKDKKIKWIDGEGDWALLMLYFVIGGIPAIMILLAIIYRFFFR